MIQYVFFDFGGCIDAPGIHTRTLFWDSFQSTGLVKDRSRFQEAYSRADQQMMATGEAATMGLRAFNRYNATLMAKDLGCDSGAALVAGDQVSVVMEGHLKRNREILRPLAERWPLGVISNFTGNLEVILREFGLTDFFQSVTESFQVGCAKPDPRIFRAALAKQPHPPSACVYVGDNPVNDIAPAKALGLRTILIHPPQERKECGADAYVEDLANLSDLIQKM